VHGDGRDVEAAVAAAAADWGPGAAPCRGADACGRGCDCGCDGGQLGCGALAGRHERCAAFLEQ